MNSRSRLYRGVVASALLAGCALLPAAAWSVTFQDIAAGGGSGLTYSRTPSARKAIQDAFVADGQLHIPTEYLTSPYKPHGAPGVAVLDFDGDGDSDIYVTNGPGTPNSLFRNLLRETNQLQFQDVAVSAGAALTAQDSQGVCYGDIDNDSDLDLFVVGYQDNRLLENQGDGTFEDITAASGTGGEGKTSVSCALGDVDGDGLLDILVANAFDFENIFVFADPFAFAQHNQLLINVGGNVFSDQSDSSGIRDLANSPQPGDAVTSFAASLVDIDQDGDLDAVIGNDQRAIPNGFGYPRVFQNDGTGNFTDASADLNLDISGDWRGLAFGDLNCDGRLDMFVSNVGDYIFFPGFWPPGTWASRWFLGQSDGTFADPGVGALVTTPTGWGSAVIDYDNDGDSDVVYHGGWEYAVFWDESNPGVVLNNQGCSATFTWDSAALAGSTNHLDRNVEGVATGDLNDDGFVDVVSVSGFDVTPATLRIPEFSYPLGSPFDVAGAVGFVPASVPTADPDVFAWLGLPRVNGTLSVEINSGNANRWAAFDLMGSIGIVDNSFATGRVNRDGIGGIVSFTPKDGQPVLVPVLGGSSYASQNSLRAHVGLGSAIRGTVEVHWPGGVRNRLYDVFATERVLLPEIPCSFDANVSRTSYVKCVTASLIDLLDFNGGPLSFWEALRLEFSALRAYDDSH